jgi:hypothetical protein
MNRLSCTTLLVFVTAASSAQSADLSVKAPPPAAVVEKAWTVTFASEVRYFSWESNRGVPPNLTPPNTAPGRGSQWYVPIAMQIAGKPSDLFKVSVITRTGWVRSSQTTSGLSGTVETWLDTVASGTVTYLGINGLQPFLALSVNAPTGRSALFGPAANARMDSDLVEISSFGEGWNIGPTAGVSVPLTDALMVTGSVGYTWRKQFDRERSSAEPDPTKQTPTSINPGDVVTGTISVGYQGASWAWSASGSVSEETVTTENGAPLYRAGRRYFTTTSVARSWPDPWGQTTLTGAYAHSNHNKVLFAASAPALAYEIFNTNSDVHRVGLQHLFVGGQNFVFGPTASYLHRNKNSYNAGTLQFVPAKDRWAVGGLARVAVTRNTTFNVRGEYVRTREDDRIAPGDQLFSVLLNQFVPGSAVPVVSSTGWMVAAGLNANY